jgi:16S rRNA A1518/A1519 N6-dimethyltransferase RsmA/KsgA/DIM1 with predicted DNA glycosylase/AP lyase activity
MGKGVLTAGLMHKFDRVIGVEIIESLAEWSELLKDRFNTQFNSNSEGKGTKFEVYNADIT